MKTYEKAELRTFSFLSSKEEYFLYVWILNEDVDINFFDWEEVCEAKERRDIWYSRKKHLFYDGSSFQPVKKIFQTVDWDDYYHPETVYIHTQHYWEMVPNCPPMRGIIQMDEAREQGLIRFNENCLKTEKVDASTYFANK